MGRSCEDANEFVTKLIEKLVEEAVIGVSDLLFAATETITEIDSERKTLLASSIFVNAQQYTSLNEAVHHELHPSTGTTFTLSKS